MLKLTRYVFLSLMLMSSVVSAQTVTQPDSILPEGQQGNLSEEQIDDTPRASWQNRGYGPVPQGPQAQQPPQNLQPPLSLQRVAEVPPFGANLFAGGFRGAKSDGLTPDYRVKPGDQVTLRVWGAVEINRILTVDAQGNVFIPSIGPLPVQGQNSQQLDATVREAISSIYPDSVEVYTNLQGVQPVGVFVTGYVVNPGNYSGTPNDPVLFFLDQAGGIDNDLGSYRRIRIIRDDQTVANVDLYDFLLHGEIVRPQFRDGDTIVVEERGPSLLVNGDVQREFRYELLGEQMSGGEVADLARLRAGVSHVLVRGKRSGGPFANYFTLGEFYSQSLSRGDEVTFSVDQRDETIVVELEGSYYGPSRYALPRNARLSELLDAIAVPLDMTAVQSISVRRQSVAVQQRQSLEDSLRRLETTYLGAPTSTDEEARSRVREAELIQRFVERARQVEPSGRLVVANAEGISDIRLQDGDVITIPEISDSILVSGEIMVPQAAVFNPGMSVRDYIDSAGGFTQRADSDHILVVRQNGAVVDAEGITLRPSDEILVMPKVPSSNLQLTAAITQILYQIAVATSVVLNI